MDPQSWWGVWLSGLGGSVVGGLVTFLALRWTIRHDARMRQEDRLAAAVIAACQSVDNALDIVVSRDSLGETSRLAYLRVKGTAATAMYLARAGRPRLAETLREALGDGLVKDLPWHQDDAIAQTRLGCWLVALLMVLTEWLKDPQHVGSFDEAVESARSVWGGKVAGGEGEPSAV